MLSNIESRCELVKEAEAVLEAALVRSRLVDGVALLPEQIEQLIGEFIENPLMLEGLFPPSSLS